MSLMSRFGLFRNNSNRRQVIFWWWTDQIILNDRDRDRDSDSKNDTTLHSREKDVVCEMRKSILQLKGKYMNDNGTEVDYAGMGSSDDFSDFVDLTYELKTLDIGSISPQERKAFMINIYNSLTIHGLVSGILADASSTTSRLKFYASASYIINDIVFSLNDIEHGILRGNKPSPVPLSSTPFTTSDTNKLALCLELDPRIHFALNCGAKGCPPIGVYSADSLDTQLSRATRGYLSETVVDSSKNVMMISMLFKWYRSDFGETDEDIISWIEHHASTDISDAIKKNRDINVTCPSVEYLAYDWNLPSSPNKAT